MNRIGNTLLSIFAIGMILCLFAGGMSLLGYVVALLLGGDTAAALCQFIFKNYIPVVIKFTTGIAFIGLIAMYIKQREDIKASNKTH